MKQRTTDLNDMTAAETVSPKNGGRPTKRTPELEEVILRAIAAGLRPGVAAEVGGVDRTTFERWRKADADFAQTIESAEATFEMHNLQRITRASSRTWKAAAWILERRFPERWGAKLAIGGTGEPVKVHVVRDAPGNAEDDEANANIIPLSTKETA